MAEPALIVPGVVRDLPETRGPIVAAAGKNLEGLVHQVNLHAVAVEFDLVDPAIAGRHFLDRRRRVRVRRIRGRVLSRQLPPASYAETPRHKLHEQNRSIQTDSSRIVSTERLELYLFFPVFEGRLGRVYVSLSYRLKTRWSTL
jgi:hypothetical protein